MNKKFLFASVVALLLGTTSVMADNHKHGDGPQKPKKEVVHKNDKKDNKKNDKYSKNDRHFDSKDKHKAPKHDVKKQPANHKPVAHAHKPHHKPDHKPACRPDGRHGKNCHHCHKSHCNHRGHCKHPASCRPLKKMVRVTPPFSPVQVMVRL
jgi:hypothetical protein